MKKPLYFLLFALAVFCFSSCDNDRDGDYPRYRPLITTVRTTDGSDYYFQRDNGETLYPSDKRRVPAYEAKDRQRAIIWFNRLPDIAGYDYNIALYSIQNIFTGASEVVGDQARLDELGNVPTSIRPDNCNLAAEWFTLNVGYPATDDSRHTFTLIVNEVEAPETSTENYLDVELRHGAGGDIQGYTHFTYISFDLSGIAHLLEGKKGLSLRIRTQQNGTKYLTFDLPAQQ